LLNSLGIILSKSGQWLRAATVYERGRSIERAQAGDAEVSPMTSINYAKLLVDLGREREAIPLFDAATVAATHRSDPVGIHMADLLSAPAWCAAGNLEECAARLARSGEAFHRELPPGHPTLGTLETEAAQLALQRGKPDQARAHLRRALEIFSAAKERNPNEFRALALQTELELDLGELANAAAHADQLMTEARAGLGGFPNSAWLGLALLVQGKVLAAHKDLVGARTMFDQALESLRTCIGDSAPWTQQARAELASLGVPSGSRK